MLPTKPFLLQNPAQVVWWRPNWWMYHPPLLFSMLRSTIEEFGVVSRPVAGQMAAGVAKRNHAQVGVGVSGIAGPTGGSSEKPVGMVCFGFYFDGDIWTATQYFGHIGRNEVRRKSVEFVYRVLAEKLYEQGGCYYRKV